MAKNVAPRIRSSFSVPHDQDVFTRKLDLRDSHPLRVFKWFQGDESQPHVEWIDAYHIVTWIYVHGHVYQESGQTMPASEEAELDLAETQSALNPGHQNT